MKFTFNIILPFALYTLINACVNQEKYIKQETEILNDILPQIISEENFYPVTPPPPAQFYVRWRESIEDTLNRSFIKEYKDFLSKLDENRHVISIEDSTVTRIIQTVIIENLLDKGYDDFVDLKSINTELPIEIGKLNNSGRYELINRSKLFPKGFNFKRYKGFDLTFYFYGNMVFSKPFLDRSGRYGYLVYSRDCGFECDRDCIFIIKNEDNNWTIKDKIPIIYARLHRI